MDLVDCIVVFYPGRSIANLKKAKADRQEVVANIIRAKTLTVCVGAV